MHLGTLPSDELIKERIPTTARTASAIEILISAENRVDAQLLKHSLEASRSGIVVAGSVFPFQQAHAFLSSHDVDVALVGESLEDGNLQGFKLITEIKKVSPKTRCIMMLKRNTPELVVDAFRAGAKGVFGHDSSLNSLPKCIRAVHAGQVWANKDQLNSVLEAFTEAALFRPSTTALQRPLTKREEDVVNLVAEGLTNREVAKQLGLTEHTVSNYLLRVYEKLGTSSRVELVLYQLKKQRG